MKGIRFVELIADIKANFVGFISISTFVCLGVGLFLGIQWSASALRGEALRSMDEGRMHDVTVQFPYGITKENLEELKRIDGVSEVECGYSTFSVMQDGSTGYILKMQSLPQNINKPTSIVGNLPMEPNEIALLEFWANDQNLSVGDTITLKHDATDQNDKDGMEYLKSDTYTITALVETPEYFHRKSTSLGVSNLCSGSIDCVGFVTAESFDASKFRDAYPNVYIRCDSMRDISVFSDDYINSIKPIVERIEDLGGKLGTARYKSIRNEAQDKLDDARRKITDGEKALADGKKQLEDGQTQLEEGQQKLDAGEQELLDSISSGSEEQSLAQIKLNEAYRQLSDGQAKYDAGMQTYNNAMETYAQLSSSFESMRTEYDVFVSLVGEAQRLVDVVQSKVDILSESYTTYANESTDERWNAVKEAYNELVGDAQLLDSAGSHLFSSSDTLGNALGLPLELNGQDSNVLDPITPENAQSIIDAVQSRIGNVRSMIDKINSSSLTINGITIYLLDVPDGIELVHEKLVDAKNELDAAKAELDRGWNDYYAGKSAYDYGVAEGQAKLQSAQRELEDGKQTLKDKTKELEDGKQAIQDKNKELEEGKASYKDAQDKFDNMVEYHWTVLPRQAIAGIQALTIVSTMLENVKWAMASLFILVGLFVCYSAISRLAHEQIVQIGTKKSLGFHTIEVTSLYLRFSGLAVGLGVVAAGFIAIFFIQAIVGPKAAKQFAIQPYGPDFDLVDLLVMGGIELVLILLSTWIAVRQLLKRDAIDLLRGESTANVNQHFYERWAVWKRMSLFSQTVVNNCVNDKRRVFATLVGVVGCTSLIVTAITLADNISKSFTKHYEEVQTFDAITYLNGESQETSDKVALALYNRGITSAPAYMRKLQVRSDDGTRKIVTLVVPTNEESFEKLFKVTSTSGKKAEIENGGIWLSRQYAEHMGVKSGENITLTEFSGETKTLKVAGAFNYYIFLYEFIMSPNAYREAFGKRPKPNVLLTKLDGADIDRTRNTLSAIDGYNSLADDKTFNYNAFNEMSSIMNTVVLVYLALSAVMALMVLLNLDIMFIEEKKRELIVLMICGFSTKDAKAYIYRDSIVLTILGIILGIALGTFMGDITVTALEPATVFWIKDFNATAAIVGAVGAGTFATAVLLWALRRISRFDLTDINRF